MGTKGLICSMRCKRDGSIVISIRGCQYASKKICGKNM